MEEEFETTDEHIRPTVASQLKQAREAAGLSIKDIAAKTRVPIRHLENLEAENFAALPGMTYVLGFVRNYARSLELDAEALVNEQRTELSGDDRVRRHYADSSYAPADPARIPPKSFAWGAIAVLALILIGYGIFKAVTTGTLPETSAPAVVAKAEKPEGKPAASVNLPATTGPVVLTATEEVWLRVYTEDGNKLLEKAMKAGETFTIPAETTKPLLLTGRPQALKVSVGGKDMPPLGPADRTVSDLDISAAGLIKRAADTAGGVTPVTTATPEKAATE